MGVSEISGSDCYVFRLLQSFFQKILPPTLPDSDTDGGEVVIITDSDSKSGPQKNGDSQVAIAKKRHAEEEHVFSPKVPRLGNATMKWEASSDLSMTHFVTFPHSVDRQWKQISEDPDDTKKVKQPEHKQNPRPPDKTCIKITPSESEEFVVIPEYEEIALNNSINTLSRSETVVARAHEPKFVSPISDAPKSKCDSVIRTFKNELQSMVDPVPLPSEVIERSETGSVKNEKDGVVFSFHGKNKSRGSNSNNGTIGSRELSAAQKCHSEETSVQNKVSEKKSEKVSVSLQGIPSGNKIVKVEPFRNASSKVESTKHSEKHTKKKLKVAEQSLDGSCKSSASLVSRESSIIYCKQNELHMTRDDKIGTNTKSDLLKNNPSPAVSSTIIRHGGGGGGEKEDEEEEEEDAQLSVRLQGVLYGDRNKAKSSIHCCTSHDGPSESVIKFEESSGILKRPVVRPSSTETPLEEEEEEEEEDYDDDDDEDDDGQLVTKQKSKSQRRRILSETSSDDGELQKNHKRKSAEQTKVKNNSCPCPLKAQKTLSSTPESNTDVHDKSSRISSTESVDEIKTHNNRPETSVHSVDDDRGEEIAQANKIRVSNSNYVKRMTLDDQLLASIQRTKAVVKLERLDENALKSNGLVVSKPDTESLNYTLDEDIIVISDDEEYFPSSQIFDDQKIDLELLKTEDQDAVREDLLYTKVLEDDDEDVVVFEDDESNLNDDQWFRRLSQQDLEPEPISELPPQQLKAEKEKRDSGLREEFLQNVDLLQATTDGEMIQKEMLPGDLLKTDQVKLKCEESVKKPKLSVRALVIDPPPMPRRRAFQRGISAEVAIRMFKEQVDVSQQQAKPRNIVSDTISRKGKKGGSKKKIRVQSSISDEPHFLTANEKKQISDQRKEKLKAISEKEKAVAAASKQRSMMKVPAEVRIKVTNRNRGAFLTEEAETRNIVKASEAAQPSVLSSAEKNLHFDVKKASLSSNVPKQDSVKASVSQPKKRDSRLSSAPARSINDLPRIPKISGRPSTSKSVDLEVPSCRAEVVTDPVVVDKLPMLTSAFSALSILKTSAPTSYTKVKKSVCFKKDSEMVEIRVIPVEEGSRLRPVAHKKDAPTPRGVFNIQLQQKRPDMDEVLYDILCWNPKWLEEQKNKAPGHPPPVHRDKLWPMPSSFVSYKDYLRVLTPLHLLELWSSITNESESNPSHPRKAPVVVGIDQVDAVPRLTSNKKPFMHITCHAVLSDFESKKRFHPYTGDLVYLELELENKDLQNHHNSEPHQSTRQRRIVPIFAYVKHSVKDTVTVKHSTRPTTKLILTLQTKFRPYDVKMSHAMRIKVVSYIKSDLRLFRAMAYLPFSPLCYHILKPTEQDFSLPDHKGQQFVPLIKQNQLNESQKQAILKIADACLKSESKICMIHGPPGTGKSHVIVNLILQILYGQKQHHKHANRRNVPKILICAPSNAAIDELVIRLLHIRETIQKEERFRMVRTGRQETMKPSVKEISVFELAKSYAKSTTQPPECLESLELEIRSLEARQNSLLMALETARQKNLRDAIAETEFRLIDTELRLAQMRKSKAQNVYLDPYQQWCKEREAQSRILHGAHIVATTLSSCFNSQMENIFAKQEEQGKSGLQFTCCIVDEATQSQEVETLIPLMLGVKTLVLVGDARQLPATVLSKVAKDNGLGKSLFARIETCFEDSMQKPVQFLDVQYRMHPEICLWPNRFFYNGRLHSAPNLAQQRVCPLLPYCILSLEYKQNVSGELSNAGEAELVSQLTLGLLEKLGNQQLSIGIITPYQKQRATIISILKASCCASENVEVNTIDSFQGQERDIIVMSCVRTGGVGFLSDTRRLNVALTRARYSLLLCGNFTSLRNDNTWRALLENAIQRNVLKHVPSSVARNKDELLKLVLRDM
ncbi:hypothetical protein B7P43_G17187 [Cryptotermes secundus]|uniref:Helicase senataxin n=1 Tax=Cryptotermes secundus TaxID=105785 RepID=A0A2J7QSQ7_9NEOP|nr:probable helicase senataxin isoform X3 [Cryptotermes secundus]PNF31614.1 hypothetical protein B7P43_G17187 [Cryptotermes secundus]